MIDIAALLAETRRRDVDRSGIPMYLALVGASPAPPDDGRRVEGARLAEELVRIHAALVAVPPEQRPDVVDGVASDGTETDGERLPDDVDPDEVLVSEALAVLAFATFGPDPRRVATGPDRAPGQQPTADAPAGPGELPTAAPARSGAGAGTDPGPGDPAPGPGATGHLDRVVTALREGRYIRVVNYHNTPAANIDQLRTELSDWGRRFAPVGVDDLDRLIETGVWDGGRPPLIPVFYEGYRNNYEVAAPVCAAVGLTGWFFVITGFVDTPPARQVAYARARAIGLVDEEQQRDRIAMTWEEVAEVAEHHVVNAHTANHASLRSVRTADDVGREVGEPTVAVADATGRRSAAHAWLYGTGLGVSTEHDVALRNAGYRWCFSNTAIGNLHQSRPEPETRRT
jgi:peptidoglycan/xylan/chitin deacetylase (PgdA/CDA1 family)